MPVSAWILFAAILALRDGLTASAVFSTSDRSARCSSLYSRMR